MASSKPTGLHYALVILSLLTIVCGVFWILNHKWYNEAKETTLRAQADQKKATDALNKMARALSEFMVTGVKTTIPFELAILQDPDFRRGNYTTNFVERFLGGARRELIQDKA